MKYRQTTCTVENCVEVHKKLGFKKMFIKNEEVRVHWWSVLGKRSFYFGISWTVTLPHYDVNLLSWREGSAAVRMGKVALPPLPFMYCPVQNREISSTDSSLSIYSSKYQSWARDNTVATKRPCFQATKLFVIARLLYWCGYSIYSRHRDLHIFRISCVVVVVVAKL